MALNEDTIAAIAKTARDLFDEAETEMLIVVARRLTRGVTQPGWAEAKLAEITLLRRQLARVVATLERRGETAAVEALTKAWSMGQAAAVADLRAVGNQAGVQVAVSRTRLALLIDETVTPIREAARAMLRVVEDVYRVTVAQAAGLVVAGVDTRVTATRRVVRELARNGLGGFVDVAGRRWHADSYAEMAIRSAANRSAALGRMEKLQAAGHDLVIVSDHAQECALCRPWEGKVLSISGRSDDPAARGVPSVDEAIAAGLFHPNCRHTLGIYIPGRTKVPTRTADPEGDRLRQRQRALERQVRGWKRRRAVADATGDVEAAQRAAVKIRERQGVLREFVDSHGLKRRRDREQVLT